MTTRGEESTKSVGEKSQHGGAWSALVDATNASQGGESLGLNFTKYLVWRADEPRKKGEVVLVRGPYNSHKGASEKYAEGHQYEGELVVEKDRVQRRFRVKVVRWVRYSPAEIYPEEGRG